MPTTYALQFLGSISGDNNVYPIASGLGLAFFGPAFGANIGTSGYNSTTYISDSTGTFQGHEVNNAQYNGPSGVKISRVSNPIGTSYQLNQVSNMLSTLNIRFVASSGLIQTQNVKMYCYDRVNKFNSPSGTVMYIAELVHPDGTANPNGSGSPSWVNVFGSGSILSLAPSPGSGGWAPNGFATQDRIHDWYILMSVTPQTDGSKIAALWIDLEYL